MTNTSLSTSTLSVALAVGLLLLVPFVAMQFTNEVSWGLGDFAIAGALLFGAGMTYILAARLAQRTFQRAAIALAILSALVVVWAELAVGIFR